MPLDVTNFPILYYISIYFARERERERERERDSVACEPLNVACLLQLSKTKTPNKLSLEQIVKGWGSHTPSSNTYIQHL